MLRVYFWLLKYPHLLVVILLLALRADHFGQKSVLNESLFLALTFPHFLAETSESSGPLSLADRHQLLKARKNLKVESCRLFSQSCEILPFPT